MVCQVPADGHMWADDKHPSSLLHGVISDWVYSSLEGASRAGLLSMLPLRAFRHAMAGDQWPATGIPELRLSRPGSLLQRRLYLVINRQFRGPCFCEQAWRGLCRRLSKGFRPSIIRWRDDWVQPCAVRSGQQPGFAEIRRVGVHRVYIVQAECRLRQRAGQLFEARFPERTQHRAWFVQHHRTRRHHWQPIQWQRTDRLQLRYWQCCARAAGGPDLGARQRRWFQRET